MAGDVTIYYLEMDDVSQYRPVQRDAPLFDLRRVSPPLPEYNRFLYACVGHNWFWTDKLNWSYEQWRAYADRDELETWVAYVEGTPAGYFELERRAEDRIEIAYFGLTPPFVGKGLGGALLGRAIERAWVMGANRVSVNTCTLDHPSALTNYLNRGFKLQRQETISKQPQPPRPEPW
jgi:GNAT superfamily N-acetyltransferase